MNEANCSISASKFDVVKRKVANSYIDVFRSLLNLLGDHAKIYGLEKLSGVSLGLKFEVLLHAAMMAPKVRKFVNRRRRLGQEKAQQDVGEGGSDAAGRPGEPVADKASRAAQDRADGSAGSLRIFAVVVKSDSRRCGAVLVVLSAGGVRG